MSDISHILTDIARLTCNIQTNYPELYRFLDENPMTIPSEAHPHLDKETLGSYLEDLKEILKRYLLSHKASAK